MAQDSRNGTNTSSQMLVPVDAHYLGGAGAVSAASGIESVLWNPAGLDAGDDKVQLMLSHRNYIADIGINFAAVGFRFGSLGAFAVHLRSFAIGDIPFTDEFNMDGTGETFSPTVFTIGGTYGRAMTDRIRVGATANLIYESITQASASGISLDAGVQYSEFLGVDGLNIGVAIRNIGSSMKYSGSGLLRRADATGANRPTTTYQVAAASGDMPTVVDIAASFSPRQGFTLGVNYMENTYGPSEIKALAAYDFMGYLTVRGAYNFTVSGTDSQLENIWDRPALGATLNLKPVLGTNVMFDYGFMPVGVFDQANHAFALRAGF